MWNGSVLLRRYRDGEAAIAGFLDDYAFFAQALLDLYETDFDLAHLETAMALTERMLALFEDRADGAFFSTAEGDPELVLRMKDDYDGAEPAGNSVAILNLLRLARITGRRDFAEAADRALRALAPRNSAQPIAVPQLLVALMFQQSRHLTIQFTGDPHSDLVREARAHFLPNAVMSMVGSNEGTTSATVCRDQVCGLPLTDRQSLRAALK
jgi:uncharacterized protein YyaL (SSP411 family)